MSVTVHQILSDAKRLVSRLREHDSAADNIVQQTQTLYKNVEAMKEYYEDVSDSHHHHHQMTSSRPLVVFEVAQENRHILELQQENRELRDLLEEHQSVLQLVMSKYRQRVTRLLLPAQEQQQQQRPDLLLLGHCSQVELQRMADEICGAAEAMKASVQLDDLFYATEQERLAELITENRGLVEMLHISRDYGSLHHPPLADTLEKAVQTEDDDDAAPPPSTS